MGFGEFLRQERIKNETGKTTDEQYAKALEEKAKRVPDPKDADYLKSRARFVRSRKEATDRAERDKW